MVTFARAASPVAAAPTEQVLSGIAMTCLSMAVFSCQDGISKFLTAGLNPVEIAALRYLVSLILLAPFVVRTPRALRSSVPLLQLQRALAMTASSIFFIFGLSALPIAEATAIGFVAPLLVTALSIPLLGEKVGARRWTAVVVGFVGVLIVIQPGTAAFRLAAIHPLLSAAAWAFGLVLTRMMRSADSVLTTMVYSSAIGFIACAPALPFLWRTPSGFECAIIAAQGSFYAAGQVLLVAAFNRAPASILAPFSYSQMLSATVIGYFAFAAVPDLATWIGAAIVIASGLYTLHRERIVALRARVAAA